MPKFIVVIDGQIKVDGMINRKIHTGDVVEWVSKDGSNGFPKYRLVDGSTTSINPARLKSVNQLDGEEVG